MREEERRDFLAWYESQRSETFDSRQVLETYFQDEVSVLRQVCRVFICEFMQIGHIDVFVKAITKARVCNKDLRKRYLKSDTIGLVQTGGYTCNNRYSKKALMWLLHMEQTDGLHIVHCRNGRETGCGNYVSSAWMFTASRLLHFTRTLAVFGTCTCANRSVM